MGATAGGRRVVVARDEAGDALGELRGERRALGRRAKTDLSIEGEGREVLALFFGAAEEVGNLAHDPRREGDQVACREPVSSACGIAGRVAQRGGGDDVGGGGGDD